jgi:hypothetical protein
MRNLIYGLLLLTLAVLVGILNNLRAQVQAHNDTIRALRYLQCVDSYRISGGKLLDACRVCDPILEETK